MNATPKDTVFHGGIRRLLPGQALRLPRPGGELTVLRGRLWLTRNRDLGDHFIEAGQRVRLATGENAVVEPADGDRGASLHWEPRRRALAHALLARPLSGAAFLSLLAARAFMALARSAATGARLARGHNEICDRHAVLIVLEQGGVAVGRTGRGVRKPGWTP